MAATKLFKYNLSDHHQPPTSTEICICRAIIFYNIERHAAIARYSNNYNDEKKKPPHIGVWRYDATFAFFSLCSLSLSIRQYSTLWLTEHGTRNNNQNIVWILLSNCRKKSNERWFTSIFPVCAWGSNCEGGLSTDNAMTIGIVNILRRHFPAMGLLLFGVFHPFILIRVFIANFHFVFDNVHSL